jgi:hypothetical protein
VLAVVAVAAVAVGVVAFARSRQTERSVQALCVQLGAAQDLDQALTTLDPATLTPQVQALEKAKAAAPGDIEPSVSALADFVAGVTDAVDEAGGDRQSALADALDERQDQIEEMTAAGAAVQRWALDNCDLTLTGIGGTSAPAPATSSTEAP